MGFEQLHPLIHLVYFVVLFWCLFAFQHPLFLAISYVIAFGYSIQRNGKKALRFNLCLIPLVLLYTCFYASYHHFGVTTLWVNAIGNAITQEACVSGLVRGMTLAAALMWMSCVFSVVTTGEILYLTGRVWPKGSLFLSVLYRMVPQIKQQARTVNCARSAIGKGTSQGSLWRRLVNGMALVSAVLTWLLERIIDHAAVMRCRGFSLKGRTAFSRYTLDNRDRISLVLWMLLGMVLLLGSRLGVMDGLYDPMIQYQAPAWNNLVYYLGYVIYLALPMAMQQYMEAIYEQ